MKVCSPGTGCGAGYIGLDRLSQAERDEFVRSSPYGRCAYDADNDVVDHQVVNFQFEGGATGTFTMTAFAPGGRRLRIHGTHGYLSLDVDHHRIQLQRFWGPGAGRQCIEVPAESGGDDTAMEGLVRAIRENDPSLSLSVRPNRCGLTRLPLPQSWLVASVGSWRSANSTRRKASFR